MYSKPLFIDMQQLFHKIMISGDQRGALVFIIAQCSCLYLTFIILLESVFLVYGFAVPLMNLICNTVQRQLSEPLWLCGELRVRISKNFGQC